MSDILKTRINPSYTIDWQDGEQPAALKFRNIFGIYTEIINKVCALMGPLHNQSIVLNAKNKVFSSRSFGALNESDKTSYLADLNRTIINTFNLARIIGPHGLLNPLYVPGSKHLIASQSVGYPLLTFTKIQKLPFPRITGGSVQITNGLIEWTETTSKELVAASTGTVFYISPEGVLYSSRAFSAGASIKYDLYIPATFGVLKGGYNCIPDLSILSLSDIERWSATGDANNFGAVKVEFVSSSSDTSTWRITLPQIITNQDPITTNASKIVSGFEPVGKYSASKNKKFYYLEENLYSNTLLEDNTLVLFDSSTDESYLLKWQKDISGSYGSEDVPITYLASGPSNLISKFKGNSLGDYLAEAGGSNTKHFFIFSLGTSISETVAQNTINFAKHAHNGIDSERINHKDLVNAEGNLQGFYQDQNSTYFGLDFINYNRQLAYSNSKDNVHPQYMNRLGYMYGGSHGFYHDLKGGYATKLVDLNLFHGDFIFYPIDSISMGPRPFKYADSAEYFAAFEAGDIAQTIEWDLDLNGVSIDNALTNYFGDSRSHATIYGYPYRSLNTIFSNSSTKLYYEPHNFIVDSGVDNAGQLYSLSRHGFIPGNKTTGGDLESSIANESNIKRGLNINWGNLFFGHREDIYNGLLVPSDEERRSAASAFWRVSEFDVLTTSNGKSGSNTNSSLKQGYSWRDGFSVRGTQGSNIWLSAGAETEDPTANSKNENGRASTIALEVSGSAWYDPDTNGRNGLKTLVSDAKKASGAGLFMSPSLDSDNKIPWAYKPIGFGEAFTIGQMWNNSAIDVTNGTTGSVIDLFSVAEDYNTSDSLIDIPLGSDQSLFQWIYGRPFIRGTYGINFCLEGSFDEAIPGFPNGFDRKNNLSESFDWGVNNVSLSTGSKEYVHREFRFWGKQNQFNEDASSDARGNAKGGNINLLYNFGRDYKRFGKNLLWDNSSTSGESKSNSIWTNARITAVGSSTPENYGSAIRQASYVEAFEGFRNDPSQPFVSEYVFPFRVKFTINQLTMPTSYNFPLTYIHDQSIVLVDNPSSIDTSVYNLIPGGVGLGNGIKVHGFQQEMLGGAEQTLENPFGATSPKITFDGLIRGAEEIFLKNSGLNRHTRIFPRGLVDISLSLENYIGYSNDGTINASNSPHETNFGDFGNIKGGKGIMLSAKDAIVSVTGESSHPPIIRSSNSSNFGVGGLNIGLYGSPYSSALTCLKRAVGGGEVVNHIMRFPLFNEQYPDFYLNNLFGFIIGLESSTVLVNRVGAYNGSSQDANISLPYRVYPISIATGSELPYGTVVTGNNQHGLGIEFNGYITIKYVTTASMYYNGLDNLPVPD